MGAYFTRLADLRVLRVCYLAMLSPSRSLLSLSSEPLLSSTGYFFPSPSLPPFLFLSLSSSFLSFFSRAQPAGDRATNMRGELCLPFVKILDVSLIGMRGGSHIQRGKKVTGRARSYEEPLTTASNPRGIMTTAGQNLPSKRP